MNIADFSYRAESEDHWKIGCIRLGECCFDVEAKVYDGGSVFGINEGRISKLFVSKKGSKKFLLCYDRGWAVKPRGDLAKILLSIVLKEFE